MIDAIEMATDAACGWILGELEDGNDIPKASPQTPLDADSNSFINLLLLDMDLYSEKYGNKCVRKNITIPAWLNTYGERHHLKSFQKFCKTLSSLWPRSDQPPLMPG